MLEDIASKIKLLILDVDGVMTDGGIVIDDLGRESKSFDVKDGQGLKLLMNSGVEVAIVTGRKSGVVENRAKELGIRDVYQGVKNKESQCYELLKRKNLTKDQVCCIGDDLPDIQMFKLSGLPVAVADAVPEVREAACHVTDNKGGKGAVREVCEIILKAQGAWIDIVSGFREK